MDRMEKPPLQSFVTWQKAVRLAAHLYRLSWAEEHRAQGEDLRREAMHLACAIAGPQAIARRTAFTRPDGVSQGAAAGSK